MKNLIYFLICFFILHLTASSQKKWEEVLGPAGGNVNCFAANETHIFIGNEYGIFTSDNYGLTWDHPFFNGVTKLFAVKNRIIALSGKDLLITSDNGSNWDVVPTTGINDVIMYNKQVYALSNDYIIVFDTIAGNWGRTDFLISVNFKKLFISGDKYFGFQDLFYLSEDFGVTWNHIPTLDYVDIVDLVDYKGKILAITHSSLLNIDYKNGNQSIISNFDPGVKLLSLYVQNDSLFIACADRIMLTTDGGKTFTVIKLPYIYTGLGIYKYGDQYYAGMSPYGLFISNRIGNNWRNIGIYKQNIKYMNSIDGILFASSNYTSFSSSDHAKTWDISQIIYENTVTPAVKIIKHKNTIFSVSRLGIFPFDVSGRIWNMDNELLLYEPIVDIADNDSVMVVCMNLGWFFISYNDAASWSTVNVPKISNVGFIGDTLIANNLYSTDYGNNFQFLHSLPRGQTDVLITNGNKLYILTQMDTTLTYTSDLGSTWIDLPVNPENSQINALRMFGNNLVAATKDNRIYTCSADDYQWKNITNNFSRDIVNTFAFDGNYLYAGTDNGIYRINYLTAGVPDANNNPEAVNIFPNPSNGNFSIEFVGNNVTDPIIEISNIFGEKLKSFNFKGNKLVNNILALRNEDLLPGIYFCKISSGKMIKTIKLIIKR